MQRLLALIVGGALLGTGLWILFAAPEPVGVLPEPATPIERADGPANPPSTETPTEPEPDAKTPVEPPDPGAEEFEPPTAQQVEDMTSSDYWGWLIVCHENGSRRARREFVELTQRFAPDRYHEQVWAAIWARRAGVELRAQPGDPEVEALLEKNLVELEWFARVIEDALDDAKYLERVTALRGLTPTQRPKFAWALGRYRAGQRALDVAKDARSALARAEAGWSVIEQMDDDKWKARFLALMARCHTELGSTGKAVELLQRAQKLDPKVAIDPALDLLKRLTDELERSMADK